MYGNVTDEMRLKWSDRIDFLIDHQDKLSEWEVEFVDSISGKDLSLKQSFKLGEIYNKIVNL